MRVLTVRQPWAWAIIHGGKDVENRVRNIAGKYRGKVAIHAGLERSTEGMLDPRIQRAFGGQQRTQHFGRIIGLVDIVDVHAPFPGEGAVRGDTCSPWAEADAWHLVLANPRPLTEPIPFRGALGLRTLDAETAALVAEAVA